MNTSKLEARKPELLAQIKNWLETEGLLQPGHEVILSISVVPSTALRIEFGDDPAIDMIMAMPLRQFVQKYRVMKDRSWTTLVYMIENNKDLQYLGQLVRMDERRFLRYRNVGRKTMNIIRDILPELNPGISFGQKHLKMGPLEKAALESIPIKFTSITLRSFTGDPSLKLETLGQICSATRQELEGAFKTVHKWLESNGLAELLRATSIDVVDDEEERLNDEFTTFDEEICSLREQLEPFGLTPSF